MQDVRSEKNNSTLLRDLGLVTYLSSTVASGWREGVRLAWAQSKVIILTGREEFWATQEIPVMHATYICIYIYLI